MIIYEMPKTNGSDSLDKPASPGKLARPTLPPWIATNDTNNNLSTSSSLETLSKMEKRIEIGKVNTAFVIGSMVQAHDNFGKNIETNYVEQEEEKCHNEIKINAIDKKKDSSESTRETSPSSEWVGWVRPDKPPRNQKISGWGEEKIEKVDRISIKVEPPPSLPVYLTPKNSRKDLNPSDACEHSNAKPSVTEPTKHENASLNTVKVKIRNMQETVVPDSSQHLRPSPNRSREQSLSFPNPLEQKGDANHQSSSDEMATLRQQNVSLKRRLQTMERRMVEGMRQQVQAIQAVTQQKEITKARLAQLHEVALRAEETRKRREAEKEELEIMLDEAKKQEDANACRLRTLFERMDSMEEELEKKDAEIASLQNELTANGLLTSGALFRSTVLPSSIPEEDEEEETSDEEENMTDELEEGDEDINQNDKESEEGLDNGTEGRLEGCSNSDEIQKLKEEKHKLERKMDELLRLSEEEKLFFQEKEAESEQQIKQLEEVVESQLAMVDRQEREACESITYLTGHIETLHNKITILRAENDKLKKKALEHKNKQQNEANSPQNDVVHPFTPHNSSKGMPEFHDPWFQS
mmetsp:Transcript_19824/g.25625  ORF Transcript_19824/g.25625 Transcript_19824/m.25625 type:complete len:582 (-) Transcript_19824:97-1842(-)